MNSNVGLIAFVLLVSGVLFHIVPLLNDGPQQL